MVTKQRLLKRASQTCGRQSILTSFAILVLMSATLLLASISNASLQENQRASEQNAAPENPANSKSSLFNRFQELVVPVAPVSETDRRLQGKVTDSSGEPIENAVIAIWRIHRDREGVFDPHCELTGKATTDSNGLYSVQLTESRLGDWVKSGAEELQCVVVDSQNRIGYRGRAYPTKISLTNPVQVLDESLGESSGRIEGTLLAPGGRPLGGIEIKIIGLHGRFAYGLYCDYPPFQFRSVTDEKGHFEIDNLLVLRDSFQLKVVAHHFNLEWS